MRQRYLMEWREIPTSRTLHGDFATFFTDDERSLLVSVSLGAARHRRAVRPKKQPRAQTLAYPTQPVTQQKPTGAIGSLHELLQHRLQLLLTICGTLTIRALSTIHHGDSNAPHGWPGYVSFFRASAERKKDQLTDLCRCSLSPR